MHTHLLPAVVPCRIDQDSGTDSLIGGGHEHQPLHRRSSTRPRVGFYPIAHPRRDSLRSERCAYKLGVVGKIVDCSCGDGARPGLRRPSLAGVV